MISRTETGLPVFWPGTIDLLPNCRTDLQQDIDLTVILKAEQ